MFIIDFDDTLFDTQAFKEARLKALKKFGVSTELFWTTYKKARVNNDGVFTYSDIIHAQILGSAGYSETEILKAFKNVNKKIKSFLMKDTEDFLKFLKTFKQPLILLSLGETGFQELKVKETGIDKYFDRMFMINKSKGQVLQELIKAGQDYWFINDKVDEAQQLKISFPNLQIVLKMSEAFPREVYSKSGLPHFPTLAEIQNYLKIYAR